VASLHGEWARLSARWLAMRIEEAACGFGFSSSTKLINETRNWILRQPELWRDRAPAAGSRASGCVVNAPPKIPKRYRHDQANSLALFAAASCMHSRCMTDRLHRPDRETTWLFLRTISSPSSISREDEFAGWNCYVGGRLASRREAAEGERAVKKHFWRSHFWRLR